jgi:GntR family transcriptional regulator
VRQTSTHRASSLATARDAAIWAELPEPSGEDAPLHRQITEAITRQIDLGELRPGNMLPPELELARQFGVSRHTVRAGIAGLVRAGLLARHRGRGTFVTRPRIQQSLARFYSLAHEMRAQGKQLETRVLARGRIATLDEVARMACEQLDIDDPAQVGYLRRLRLVDGIPLLLELLTFPVALCPELLREPAPGTLDLGAAPFYDVLAEYAGVHVARAHETLRPGTVAGEEALLLRVPPLTPVFAVERISTADEQPVEWRQALVRGDRFAYTVDLLNPVEEGDSG